MGLGAIGLVLLLASVLPFMLSALFLRPMVEKIVSCPENGGTWHAAIRKTEREDQ